MSDKNPNKLKHSKWKKFLNNNNNNNVSGVGYTLSQSILVPNTVEQISSAPRNLTTLLPLSSKVDE